MSVNTSSTVQLQSSTSKMISVSLFSFVANPQAAQTLNIFQKLTEPVSNYRLFTGKDYPGHNLRMIEKSSPQQCANECSKLFICTGFQYHYISKRCWIKKTVQASGPNFKQSSNGALYVRNVKLNIPGYTRYPGKDYPGFDINKFPNYNREACGMQCNRNGKCLAFEFNINNRDCALKTQAKASGNNFKNHQHGELFIRHFNGKLKTTVKIAKHIFF